jgi:hypothetical protein
MRMRAILIPMLMIAGLTASSRQFCLHAVARSTHAFYAYFEELRQESLNPVQRVMLSLELTRADIYRAPKPRMHL